MTPSNHLILCHSLLLPPLTFPSIRVFSNESVLCIRWPKYQSLCNKTLLKYSYTYMINILHFILGKTECMSRELIVKVVFLLLMDRIHQLKPFFYECGIKHNLKTTYLNFPGIFTFAITDLLFLPQNIYFFHFFAHNLSTISRLFCRVFSPHIIWVFKIAQLILHHANLSHN